MLGKFRIYFLLKKAAVLEEIHVIALFDGLQFATKTTEKQEQTTNKSRLDSKGLIHRLQNTNEPLDNSGEEVAELKENTYVTIATSQLKPSI